MAAAPLFAKCANLYCPCTAAWTGKAGDFCCKACMGGTPCKSNIHSQPTNTVREPLEAPPSRKREGDDSSICCTKRQKKDQTGSSKEVSLVEVQEQKVVKMAEKLAELERQQPQQEKRAAAMDRRMAEMEELVGLGSPASDSEQQPWSPNPNLTALLIMDPRDPQLDTPLIAFYYPGRFELWDILCGCGFLGNFWEVGTDGIQVHIPANSGRISFFTNAESAFQATKFASRAEDFRSLDGEAAFNLKRSSGFAGQEDKTYGGFGGNWKAMLNVLRQKFAQGNKMAQALQSTKDAYLLEHNSRTGRDKVWSDNSDGKGMNWLGLQLMVVRDELNQNSEKPNSWSTWIQTQGLINLQEGKRIPNPGQVPHGLWQASVQYARDELASVLD